MKFALLYQMRSALEMEINIEIETLIIDVICIIQLLKKTFAKDFQEYPEWSEISLWWCRLVIIVEFPSVIANKVFDLSVPPMFWLTFLMKSQRIHQFGETQILAVDILKLSGVV